MSESTEEILPLIGKFVTLEIGVLPEGRSYDISGAETGEQWPESEGEDIDFGPPVSPTA